jgi:hypothetical protein
MERMAIWRAFREARPHQHPASAIQSEMMLSLSDDVSESSSDASEGVLSRLLLVGRRVEVWPTFFAAVSALASSTLSRSSDVVSIKSPFKTLRLPLSRSFREANKVSFSLLVFRRFVTCVARRSLAFVRSKAYYRVGKLIRRSITLSLNDVLSCRNV